MQVYVDDPILIAAGSREQRLRLFTVVLLFWAALGFDLSWKKQGPERPESRVDWWRIQFALRWSRSATHRSENPGCKRQHP